MKKTLLSCFVMFVFTVMLIGTTYAWWSESIVVDENIIQMGKLDLTLEFATSRNSSVWYDLEEWDTTGVFETRNIIYPDCSDDRYVKVSNTGTIPLAYRLVTNVDEENELKDYIDFTIISLENNRTIWSKPLIDLTTNYVILQPGQSHMFKVSYYVLSTLGDEDGTFGENLDFPFTFEFQAEQVGKVMYRA